MQRRPQPHRQVVFLSQLDVPRAPTRGTRPERYLLEYAEICDLMEWAVGDMTYQPGFAEDFDLLALTAVAREQEYSGELDCAYLRPGWCLHRDDAQNHMHPLCAARYDNGEVPLNYSQHYDQRCECLDADIARQWDTLVPLIAEARHWTLEHIDQILTTPLIGGHVAKASMRLAGFALPDGLDRRGDVDAAFRMHTLQAQDRGLRNAYADWVAINLAGHLADDSPVMARLSLALEQFEEGDAPIIDPDELQWLAFAPNQFPAAQGEPGWLRGLWTATDAHYISLFDEEFDTVRTSYPLALGWREIDMSPAAI